MDRERTKVIFVGMHNKGLLQPLCSSTKSGKLIDRICRNLNTLKIEWQKTNLYDIDHYPSEGDKYNLFIDWVNRIKSTKEDIIVLLGREVHDNFYNDYTSLRYKKTIKIAHPASKRSHAEMDRYVTETMAKILTIVKPLNFATLDSNPKAFK